MRQEIQAAFRALADPTRREILTHLSKHDMTIGEVASKFEVTRAAVKKHLIILEEGNLISVRSQGRERINHLEAGGLKHASEWMSYFSQFWDGKLSALQEIINEEDNKNGK